MAEPTSAPQNDQQASQEQPKRTGLQQKYGDDWQKADAGYWNAVKELGNTQQALQTAQAETQRLMSMIQAATGGAPANPGPFAELAALGLNAQALEQAIDARTQEGIAKLFGPVMTQMEAEEQLANEIPDFDSHKTEARAYMKENPDVAETFKAVRQSNPAAAWRYAIRESLISKAQKAQPRPLPRRAPDGRFVEGQGVTEFDAQASEAREKEALEYMGHSGDSRAYTHERLKGTSVDGVVRASMQQLGFLPPEE